MISGTKAMWIEITSISGEVEAVCTLAEFRAANEGISDEEIVAIEALEPGEHVAFGGGAAPEMMVERCSAARAAALDEIAGICERHGAGAIEIQVQHDEDEAPLPYSIWVAAADGADSDIIGAGGTLDEAIAEALADVHKWQAVAS